MNYKDSYNLMLFGDSISKGVAYDDERGKYVTLKDSYSAIIMDRFKGITYNAARFGNTILRGLKRLQSDVIKNNPDIVLIEFGGNDCDFNWEEVAKNPNGKHLPNTEYEVFQKSLRDLVDYFKNSCITPVLMTLPPIDADRYFNWISKNDESMAQNILKWLGSVNKIYWWQERYNAAVLSVAQETKTMWIDVRSAFLEQPDFTQLICRDGIHPNALGHRIIADKLIGFVQENYPFLLRDDLVLNI